MVIKGKNHTYKKIAFVSDAVYPYNVGGKETRLYEVSTRLSKIGHEVTVYTMKWWSGNNDTKKENGVYLKAISPYMPLYKNGRRSLKQAIYFGISCFRLLWFDFDYIEVDSMPYLPLYPIRLICWIRKKPMFASWHEAWPKSYWLEYLGIRGLLAFYIEKFSSYLPDKIFSVSLMTTRNIMNIYGRKSGIHTIPNGIDLKRIMPIKPATIRADVIYSGRLLKHKNIDLLIKALSCLKSSYPRIKCLIIGEGPEKNHLIGLSNKYRLGDNIQFADFINNKSDYYAQIKSSRVYVLPSSREGFGLSVLEANACGIPAITINHPQNAATLLIKNNVNGLVSNADPVELSECIYSVINSYRKYLKKVRDYIKDYSWDKSLKPLFEIYSI